MDDFVRMLAAFPAAEAAAGAAVNATALAVATVVNTRGSAYRRPGARMIIGAGAALHGAVSAGCLERDIIAHCDNLQDPLLLTYDGNSRDDLLFGLKLGCDGIVQILVESAGPGSSYYRRVQILSKLLPELLSTQKRIVAATIFSLIEQSSGRALSSWVGTTVVTALNQSFDVEAVELPVKVLDYLKDFSQKLLTDPHCLSTVVRENVGGLALHVLFEIVEAPTSLLIFGNGQEVDPLRQFSSLLGWQVTVVDDRKNSFRMSGQRVDAAVVITHDYERDRQILLALLNTDVPYIGVVGPRRRADKLLAELALAGHPITSKERARLYSPVGLDIGAERPEEIALAIVAEVKAALAGHSGGMLRQKQGAIHESQSIDELAEGIALNAICQP